MTRKAKKKPPRICEWCGTKFRLTNTCPRGPACAQEQANHEALKARIDGTDRRRPKRKGPR